jgi:2'-deoxymugineic-acid 2'-dioxygenase/mugineic-acid 3-dioxygenase
VPEKNSRQNLRHSAKKRIPIVYGTGGERYWRDCLRLTCGGFPVPAADAKNTWPDKPDGLREAMERFVAPTRALGMELLCEGVGLCPDYFEGDLSAGDVVVNFRRKACAMK